MSNYSPDVPRNGRFTITVDNSPFSLEGRAFSYKQIMGALQKGMFRPGMKFRHARAQRDFVLTAGGLLPHKAGKH